MKARETMRRRNTYVRPIYVSRHTIDAAPAGFEDNRVSRCLEKRRKERGGRSLYTRKGGKAAHVPVNQT